MSIESIGYYECDDGTRVPISSFGEDITFEFTNIIKKENIDIEETPFARGGYGEVSRAKLTINNDHNDDNNNIDNNNNDTNIIIDAVSKSLLIKEDQNSDQLNAGIEEFKDVAALLPGVNRERVEFV